MSANRMYAFIAVTAVAVLALVLPPVAVFFGGDWAPVAELTNANFTAYLAEHPAVLIMFYAPCTSATHRPNPPLIPPPTTPPTTHHSPHHPPHHPPHHTTHHATPPTTTSHAARVRPLPEFCAGVQAGGYGQ